MYGVTESEKFHVLSPVAMLQGMSDSERDDVLREHARVKNSNICFVLSHSLILSTDLEHLIENLRFQILKS